MLCHALRSADSASLTADLSSSLQELGSPLCLSRYLYSLGNQSVQIFSLYQNWSLFCMSTELLRVDE